MIRVLAMMCALVGCAGDTHDVTLELSGTCEATTWTEVGTVSVELWGIHDGQPCAIARRCLYDVDVVGAADVADALAAVNQPLVDVTDPDAHTLAVIGHQSSCFDGADQVVCGLGDLADVSGGVLDVAFQCAPCGDRDIPFCP